jgi:hypothetical protein
MIATITMTIITANLRFRLFDVFDISFTVCAHETFLIFSGKLWPSHIIT